MPFDAHKNFAYSNVATAPAPAASGTSLTVAAGEGADFPAAPFNAVVWVAGAIPRKTNGEVVRVTAIAGDVFTITRAQEGSSARTVLVGDQIAAAVTAKTLTDIENLFIASSSSPPASPATGDLWVFPADAANGVYWVFRYDAASASAFKWTYLSGPPLWSNVETFETRLNAVYGALATAGPAVTLERAGDYWVTLTVYSRTNTANTAALFSYDIGGTGAVDADALRQDTAVANNGGSVSWLRLKTGIAAATTLTAKYRASAGTGSWGSRTMSVVPARVS